MNGDTITNHPMVKSFERVGAQNAKDVRENNFNNDYCWMLNKYGRKVPVGRHLVAEKLSFGYIHTDGQFHSDDMTTRVQSPIAPVTPADAMLKVAEKLAENAEAQSQVLEEVTGIKRRRKKAEIVETEV
jgi:hypothetical protein